MKTPKERKNLRIVTFKIEEELLEKLDKIALRLGVSRSTVIRWAIQRWVAFAELEEKTKPIKLGEVEAIRIDV